MGLDAPGLRQTQKSGESVGLHDKPRIFREFGGPAPVPGGLKNRLKGHRTPL